MKLINNFGIKLFLSILSAFLFSGNFADYAFASIQVDGLSSSSANRGLVGYWSFDDKHIDRTNNIASSSIQGNTDTGTMIGMTASGARVTGKIGQGLNFNGSSRIQISNQTPFNFESNQPFSMSAWITTASNGEGFIMSKQTSSGNFTGYAFDYHCNSGANLCLDMAATPSNAFRVAAPFSPQDSNYHFAVVTYNGSGAGGVKFYFDGVLLSSSITTNTLSGSVLNGVAFVIGDRIGGDVPFTGKIDEPRVYNRVLTASEVNTLYHQTIPIISSTINNLPASFKNSLKGYWSFDKYDISGTTAIDRSGNNNSGTLTNTIGVVGKINQALDLNGSSAYADMGNGSSVTNVFDAGGTWSFWIKPRSIGGGGNGMIAAKGTGGAVQLYMCGSFPTPQVCFTKSFSGGNGAWHDNTPFNGNSWTHVVVTYDDSSSSNSPNFYINGRLVSTVADATPSGSRSTDNTSDLLIGNRAALDQYFNGLIDEARVYNRILSASEVSTLYNQQVAGYANTSSAIGTFGNGLVGWWTMDGNNTPWTSATAGTAVDSSGNGNTGTLTSMNRATAPVIGKIGQALKFNGSTAYISASDSSLPSGANPRSISAWVKMNVNSAGHYYIIGAYGTLALNQLWAFDVDNIDHGGAWTVTQFGDAVIGNVLTSGMWYHLVVTYDGATYKLYQNGVFINSGIMTTNTVLSGNLYLGKLPGTADPWNGLIDDVRIYNRALSASEIASLYRSGK